MVSRGRKGLRVQSGARGVGRTQRCGSPSQEAATRECRGRGQLSADAAIFLLAGVDEKGQGPRGWGPGGRWTAPGLQSLSPAGLRLGGRACAWFRMGGAGSREPEVGKARGRDRGPGGRGGLNADSVASVGCRPPAAGGGGGEPNGEEGREGREVLRKKTVGSL